MANYRAVANGNWSAGATWAGGAVPPNGEGHNIYSNTFTVTIDTNINVAILTNSAITASFVGGGTSAAAGGTFNLNDGSAIVAASITGPSATSTAATVLYAGSTSATITASTAINAGTTNGHHAIRHAGTGTLTITGNCNGGGSSGQAAHAVYLSGTGTINLTGNLVGGVGTTGIDALGGTAVVNKSSGSGIINVTGNVTGTGGQNHGIVNISSGIVNVFGNVTSTGAGNGILQNASGCTLSVNGNVAASSSAHGVNATAGAVTVTTGSFTSTNGFNAVVGAGTVTASGSFVYSANGTLPISAPRIVLGTTPLAARTRYALNGVGTYVDMFTADNSLGQANPTDVRTGVSYASGTLTGRLTVPARGSVALSVAYGPSMPFTATRSGTTATATLAYSYPLVVGDQITVTGASNSEWNSTYTIASVVSGTSVTFVVPATHSATAGTGALMQTTGTAVLDPAAVASAVWGAASRTITGGVVDTATTLTNAPASVTPSDIWSHATRSITGGVVDTLTNAPSVPSAAAIASQVRTELATELARVDAAISTRLASSAYTAPTTPPTAAQIATAVEGSLLNEADGQAVLNAIVGAIGNTNLSEVSLVAAVRADLERNGGKLDSIPTTAAPSASTVAGAVRTELGTELSRIDAAVSTRLSSASYTAPTTPPTAAQNASAVRTELSTELGRVDAAVSTRLASSAYTAPANSDISAIKSKTDNLPASPAATGDIPSANITSIKTRLDSINVDRVNNTATTNIVGTLLAQSQS